MLYNYNKEVYNNYKETYPLPDPNEALPLQQNKPTETYTGDKMDAMISVFPNPTDGELNVEYINIDGSLNLIIYDMQGKVIMTFKANKDFGFQTIDVSSLKRGNYLIGFGKNLTTKFIVK